MINYLIARKPNDDKLVGVYTLNKKSGLTKTVVAIVAVLLVVIAGLGALLLTLQTPTALSQ